MHAVTHIYSGMFVLNPIPEELIPELAPILGKVDWEIPASRVFQSAAHHRALDQCLKVLMSYKQRFSQRREKAVAKELGGKVQPASGSRDGYKRDIVIADILVEHKTSIPGSGAEHYRDVDLKDLEFHRQQALEISRIPAYLLEFGGRDSVAFIPEDELEGETDDLELIVVDVSQQNQWRLHRNMADRLDAGTWLQLITRKRAWLGVSYRDFLALVRD